MIVNDSNEYWVWLIRSSSLRGIYYCPKNEREYIEHWGKWLVFDSAAAIRSVAEELDLHVDRGEIDSAKFNREPSDIGRGDGVMCVYCDDRDRERVWNILRLLGLSKRIWKYDRQTHDDWGPGGRLRKRASKGGIQGVGRSTQIKGRDTGAN